MIKLGFKALLALIMVLAGILHFAKPGPFVRIVPKFLPAPLTLVYVSGVFEILGGIGLLVPQTSQLAAWGLVALFVAVFPANLNMALNNIPMSDKPISPVLAWLRLPLQGVLIAWAWWFTK